MIRSGVVAHVAEAVRARRSGTCAASSSRGSKNVPLPCISRFATNAFQCVTEPQPVQVCRLTPARPNAGGISVAADLPSGRNALPSRSSSASNLPGPQACSTVRTVGDVRAKQLANGSRLGASAMIAPDVEVAVGPAVEPMADAGRERVVDGRVAERALDADRRQRAAGEEARHADDRVELQQRERDGGIVEVDLSLHAARSRATAGARRRRP